jgi:hypothetical protein
MTNLQITLLVITMVIIIGITVYFTNYLLKLSYKFYKEADLIDEMILNGDDMTKINLAIIELAKKTFNRNSNHRVHELCKMFEVKFNVKIIH